jgi:hypothetical protein
MSNIAPFPKALELPLRLGELIVEAAEAMAEHAAKAAGAARRRRGGRTLRPGLDTPLWNEVRLQLRPLLQKHGDQARLARALGLPRQRVSDFLAGGAMPDAERTLQLLAWMIAAQREPKLAKGGTT